MGRLLAWIALGIVLAQAPAFAGIGFTGACIQACTDDADGTCPASCDSCSCCAHLRPMIGRSRAAVDRPCGNFALYGLSASVPPLPSAAEILHVPKTALA